MYRFIMIHILEEEISVGNSASLCSVKLYSASANFQSFGQFLQLVVAMWLFLCCDQRNRFFHVSLFVAPSWKKLHDALLGNLRVLH